MAKPINEELYNKVKAKAKKKFKRYPSLYASAWIQKEYQAEGGKYIGKKTNNTGQWFKEQWVQIIPYLTKGEKIECGSQNKNTKACRPLKRINSKTPITLPELKKLHKTQDIIKIARLKNKDMKKRVLWKTLKISS